MNNTSLASQKVRLESLDILRGFDLFLLVFFQPVFISLCNRLGCDWLAPIVYQFDHEIWEGFRFWDLIMPLFLFMAGASMPFSFSKYKTESNKSNVYRKIMKRFIILFVLGMVIQGNLLGLDFNHIYIYTNTLQAIAAGYLIASLVFLHFRFKNQILIALLLLLVYTIPMMFGGDYTMEGNFAYKVDAFILGRFRGDLSYTWIWSSLTFGVTVLMGVFAGYLIKEGKSHPYKVVKALFWVGIGLVTVAYLWSLEMPIIKRIWSGSMTLLSGGYCYLLMALFYYWIDIKKHKYGFQWLKIYGMNSITAYILAELINFRSIATSVLYGFEGFLGQFYPVLITFTNFLIIFLILKWMYKYQIFLKI